MPTSAQPKNKNNVRVRLTIEFDREADPARDLRFELVDELRSYFNDEADLIRIDASSCRFCGKPIWTNGSDAWLSHDEDSSECPGDAPTCDGFPGFHEPGDYMRRTKLLDAFHAIFDVKDSLTPDDPLRQTAYNALHELKQVMAGLQVRPPVRHDGTGRR
ncbi:MAG TPA: hypothetical protein VHD87_12930 [Acidimicrobiales bacterium]|nr:hypothetical protein [Acidimicrobiales bacterium]